LPSAVPPWASCTFDLPARPRAAVPVTCPQAELNQPAGLLPCTRTQALRAPSRLPCCAATQVPKRLCSQSGVGSALHLPKATPSPATKVLCAGTKMGGGKQNSSTQRTTQGTKITAKIDESKNPGGHRRIGPPFHPISVQNSMIHGNFLTLEWRKRGTGRRRTPGPKEVA